MPSSAPTVDGMCVQLKERGRRVTPQRRAIIHALLEDGGAHPTAERIFTQVQDAMPDMSPATVYNTLHELVDMGLLLELDLGLGERRYDVNTADHAHLVCLGCGRVEDVDYDPSTLALSPDHAQRFQIVERTAIFRGYCSACTSQGKGPNGVS
ncbi:MAG: Fur family transcriptional regulator [Chloroflexota bacterium]|nr:Fur family transcriptional regulator [Chloroflexota bacterium]